LKDVRHSHPSTRFSQVPVVLTIAGSDSSSGAGIQADLKTFTALGVYGLTAVTCVVAESPGKVCKIEPLSPAIVQAQIEVVAGAFPITAIKTGLLCNSEIVQTTADALRAVCRDQAHGIPLVIDPVMIATSGAELLDPKAVRTYEEGLFPLATLVIPNMDEAGKLLGTEIDDCETMERAARELAQKYETNVLVKGGHLRSGEAVDVLCCGGALQRFTASFVSGVATHGTGCTFSAAITAGLGAGLSLEEAITRAKRFVTEAIEKSLRWGDVHALKHWP
jgi:hydroxymethylpyrimidine/phosphomethylpyrimidine kinase